MWKQTHLYTRSIKSVSRCYIRLRRKCLLLCFLYSYMYFSQSNSLCIYTGIVP
uniref:Uncharacterized protein n=1 Tax=Octopus bimaculoides TaxID=37653 RepID=A0A0L8IEI8_OCTBM